MRKNLGPKPAIYPMPVLIIGTYDREGRANAMNAAWGGISEEAEISICVSAEHKTTKNILEKKCFTVSIADKENVAAADFVGIVSGNSDPEKLKRAGWCDEKSEIIDAPIFRELPMALECRLTSYDPETCRLVGEILNISCDEKILGEDGKIDLAKFHPITYDPFHHTYREIGDIVGHAFKDGISLK